MTDSNPQTTKSSSRLQLRRRGWTLIFLLSFAAVATPLVAMRHQERTWPGGVAELDEMTRSASALPVRMVRVGDVRPPQLQHSYAGLLIAEKESELSFERQGRVARVDKQEGDVVRAGEQIAELDMDDLDAKADRTHAELAAAEAVLRELVAGPRKQTIEAARASVERLLAVLRLAKADMQREQQLADNGAGSQRTLDAASYGLQRIEEELKSARAELSLLEEGTRAEQLDAQRAVCDSIRARLEEIEVSRRDSVIRAPFDGRIRSRLVDEGAVIGAGTAVVGLISDRAEGRFGLPAEVASTLHPGDAVTVSVRGQRRGAKVDRLDPTVDLTTRTRAVYVTLAAEGATQESQARTFAEWIPGQVASIHLPAEQRSDDADSDADRSCFWVPTAALTSGGRGLWTLLVLPGQAQSGQCELRAVEVLQTIAEFSQVRGMLRPDDQVITGGLHRITAGMRVTVASPQPSRMDDNPAEVLPSRRDPSFTVSGERATRW